MAHLENSYNLRSHWDGEDSFQMEENDTNCSSLMLSYESGIQGYWEWRNSCTCTLYSAETLI